MDSRAIMHAMHIAGIVHISGHGTSTHLEGARKVPLFHLGCTNLTDRELNYPW